MEWFKNLQLWKKIVYPLALATLVIILLVFFITKYNGPEENCVFINEKVNLHNEYYITVLDRTDQDSIEILKNKDDLEKTEIIGTDKHYIKIEILIEHINVANAKENHQLDINDFKLKDHTGVQIKNMYLFSKENGLALENKNFQTRTAIKDFVWFDSEINVDEEKTIVLYFEVDKTISSLDTVMVLETDFFNFRSNGKAGTDIVLAYRDNSDGKNS